MSCLFNSDSIGVKTYFETCSVYGSFSVIEKTSGNSGGNMITN